MSNKRKILIFIPSLIGGGAEKNALLMAHTLTGLKYDVTLAYMYKPNFDFEYPARLKCIFIGKKENPFHDVVNFRQTIKKVDPDYVVSFLDVINIYTFFSLIGLADIKHVANERSNPFYHLKTRRFGGLKLWLLTKIYQKVDKLLVNSKETNTQILNNMKVPGFKSRVLYNPVRIDKEANNAVREKRSILAVGRLSDEKGYSTLLKAISFLVHTHKQKDFVLNIAGQGPLMGILKQLVKQLRISNYVNFLGFRKDINSLMLSHEIFVLSSRYEGFPNTLLEAMSCGLAVVSTNCVSGPSEVIKHKFNGYLVDVGDYEGIANCLLDLFNNETKLVEISRSATNSLTAFSFSSYKQVLIDVFD